MLTPALIEFLLQSKQRIRTRRSDFPFLQEEKKAEKQSCHPIETMAVRLKCWILSEQFVFYLERTFPLSRRKRWWWWAEETQGGQLARLPQQEEDRCRHAQHTEGVDAKLCKPLDAVMYTHVPADLHSLSLTSLQDAGGIIGKVRLCIVPPLCTSCYTVPLISDQGGENIKRMRKKVFLNPMNQPVIHTRTHTHTHTHTHTRTVAFVTPVPPVLSLPKGSSHSSIMEKASPLSPSSPAPQLNCSVRCM